MFSCKKSKIPRRLRCLVRHQDAKNCPTCLFLNIHRNYQVKRLCDKERCLKCTQLHLFPFGKLRTLKRSDDEFAITIYLDIDVNLGTNSHSNSYPLDKCIEGYAQKYLAHVMREGDCISLYDWKFGRNDGLIMYYNRQFIRLGFSEDEYGHIPAEVDITRFGRANYFSDVIRRNTIVWTSFSGYEAKCLETDGIKYSLWKVAKNVEGTRAVLHRLLIPDLVGLVLEFVQDIWYVFVDPGEIVRTNALAYYHWYFEFYQADDFFYDRLTSPHNKTIIDKAKILHSPDFTIRKAYAEGCPD